MSALMNCPNCQKRLRLAEEVSDPTLICPRCLRELDNPNAEPTVHSGRAGVGREVGRDLNWAAMVIGALVALCVVGVVLAFAMVSDASTATMTLVVIFGVLIVLCGVGIGVEFGVRRRSAGGKLARALGLVLFILTAVAAVAGAILALTIFLFVTCINALSPPRRATAPGKAPGLKSPAQTGPLVTAVELLRAYKEDEAKADAKYKGKWLRVRGKVQDVQHTSTPAPWSGTVRVRLGPEDKDFPGAVKIAVGEVPFVPPAPGSGMADFGKLKKGQEVTIGGKCAGKTGDDVTLEGPVLLD